MNDQKQSFTTNPTPNYGMRGHGRGRGGGRGVVMIGPKPKNFSASLKKLIAFLKPFIFKLVIVAILSAASTVFSIVGPKILGLATDSIADGVEEMLRGTGGIRFDYLLNIIWILVAFYLASAMFSYVQGFVMAGISTRVSYNLRMTIMRKINRLPLSYFNRVGFGEVMSRISNDVDTVSQTLNRTLTQTIRSGTTLIGIIVMMLTISWEMTLVTLVTVPLSFLFVSVLVKHSQKYFKGQQKYLGTVNGHVEEMYGGHVVVKAFNGEEKSVEQFDEENRKLYDSAWKSQFLSSLMQPVMGLIGNLGYIIVCIAGAALTVRGSLTIGGIQAFIQYVRSFNQPISQVASIFNQIQQMVAAAERVFEFLEEEEEKGLSAELSAKNIDVKGDVSFRHVRFGYEDDDKIVIHDFSAEVKAGQKVAIVGPTGAGKTTIVKLLMRFHELSGGAIYIDGHDYTEFDKQSLRSRFGMVLQDTWLYTGSIMDNIRYGRPDATDAEVVEAAKAAQVDHFVRTLPGGYQMELNEEVSNISQGQKQLLTIARAILSNARILILDEATSSVDTRTEILIQRAMDNLMRGRTSFIIAHRLSTIRNADLILCMDDGDIVEQGTHDELMAKGGFYAQLYNSQFEKVTV